MDTLRRFQVTLVLVPIAAANLPLRTATAHGEPIQHTASGTIAAFAGLPQPSSGPPEVAVPATAYPETHAPHGVGTDGSAEQDEPAFAFTLVREPCRSRASPQKIVKRFDRRSIRGPMIENTALRCGTNRWGYRHIVARRHFGGVVDAYALALIDMTLESRHRYHDANAEGEGWTIYERRIECNNLRTGTADRPDVTVRVVVNPKTNNVLTAYILDREQDSHVYTCP